MIWAHNSQLVMFNLDRFSPTLEAIVFTKWICLRNAQTSSASQQENHLGLLLLGNKSTKLISILASIWFSIQTSSDSWSYGLCLQKGIVFPTIWLSTLVIYISFPFLFLFLFFSNFLIYNSSHHFNKLQFFKIWKKGKGKEYATLLELLSDWKRTGKKWK